MIEIVCYINQYLFATVQRFHFKYLAPVPCFSMETNFGAQDVCAAGPCCTKFTDPCG